MPLIEDDDSQMSDLGQLSFRDRLRKGLVVPIISDRAIFDLVMGGYQGFVEQYFRYTKSLATPPFDLVSLVKVYKHRRREKPLSDQALKFDYLNFAKNHLYRQARTAGADGEMLKEAAAQIDKLSLSEFAQQLGYCSFVDDRSHPLQILVNMPFRTILTTSPYTFIEDGLRKAKKTPRTEVCRWSRDLRNSVPSNIDDAYQPSAEEPLVYHLLGLDQYPDSLSLSEDDYLEYLGNICQGQGNESADYIPALVRKIFSNDLIVLGFSLDSWEFRVLYAGLIKRSGKREDRGICEVQLPDTEEARSFVEDYVQREAKFQVFWGSIHDYVQHELQ